MQRILRNCFDSHVHWLATGEHAQRLNLKSLESAENVSSLKIESHHFRGEWLIGWGWDQNNWSPAEFPTHDQLDLRFPDHPVAFFRADGHALWVNGKVLQKIPVERLSHFSNDGKNGRILVKADGTPSGVFIDHA